MGRASKKKKNAKIVQHADVRSLRTIDPIGKVFLAPDAITARNINLALAEMYGRDVASDRQKYRLTWATTQTEMRHGSYDLFYMETIFLRREVGYVVTPKYPHFADRWVLEELVYAPIPNIPETQNGHYEAFYCFQNKKAEYLPPLHEVADIAIHAKRNPGDIRAIIARLEREDERKFDREVAYFEDVLEDQNGSWIVQALHAKEAVSVPHNFEKPSGIIGVTKGEL